MPVAKLNHLKPQGESEMENSVFLSDNAEKSISVFENPEFGKVRTVIINNEPYFVGLDVANILEYQNGSRDINRHVDEEDRKSFSMFDGKQNRNQIVINESGLYSLILGSKLPSAKKFKHWVTSEVLPSIRKNGSYGIPKSFAEALQLAADQQKKIEEQQMAIEQSKPKVEFFDKVTGFSDTCDMKEVAKILNFKGIGRNNLFEILRNENILDKQNQPYQKYVDAGYFRVIESKWEDKDGDIHINLKTVVFQKGVDFIRKTVLKSNSYLSNEKVIKDTADNWISENEKIEYLAFSDVLNKTGLYRTAVLDFLVLRGYLKKDSIWYDVTLLGKEKGVKMEEGKLFLSSKLVERISSAFNFKTDLSVKKQGEILRKLQEAEKNMKSSSIGKAE